jgi:hypothetical protein
VLTPSKFVESIYIYGDSTSAVEKEAEVGVNIYHMEWMIYTTKHHGHNSRKSQAGY